MIEYLEALEPISVLFLIIAFIGFIFGLVIVYSLYKREGE